MHSTIANILKTSLLRKPIKQHIVQSINLLLCKVQVGGTALLGLLFKLGKLSWTM